VRQPAASNKVAKLNLIEKFSRSRPFMPLEWSKATAAVCVAASHGIDDARKLDEQSVPRVEPFKRQGVIVESRGPSC
jgi:hypothetical protein